MKLRLIHIVLIVHFPLMLKAQNDSCLNSLLMAYRDINYIFSPDSLHHVRMIYSIEISVPDDAQQIHHSCTLIASDEKLYLDFSIAKMIQDKETDVLVNHNSQSIYISNKLQAKGKSIMANSMQIRDSIFRQAMMDSCYTQLVNGIPCKIMVLSFKHIPDTKVEVDKLKCVLTSNENTLKEISTFLKAGAAMSRMKMSIDTLQHAYYGTVFEGSAVQQLYENNKLKKEFDGYQVIDLRNKN